jgi:Flp pilus assembly pilin Flp
MKITSVITKTCQAFLTQLANFDSDESAATLIEYSVMLALIVLACMTAIIVLGGEAGAIWSHTAQQLGATIN